MSTDTNRARYARENWWGDPDVKTAADEHRTDGTDWNQRTRRQEKAEYVAHLLLRGRAPALCGTTCADPDRVPVELTPPQFYPPNGGHRKHLRAIRANEHEGYLSGGESTHVVFDGVPTKEFLELVETWLAYCEHQGHIGPDLREQLRADAEAMKTGTDLRDETVVARLVEDVLAGERTLSH